MVCTLIDHRNGVKMVNTQVKSQAAGEGERVISLQSFEHFTISMVDKSIDRGKLLSICFVFSLQ